MTLRGPNYLAECLEAIPGKYSFISKTHRLARLDASTVERQVDQDAMLRAN